MKLVIIGGTRGIGKALVERCLEENHEVAVLAREPGRMSISSSLLEVVRGDVRDPEAIQSIAQEKDAVCSCIGVPITFKPVDLFSVAATNIITAVRQNPDQKYIAVTGIGAGNSKGHGGFLYDAIFKPLLLKSIYEDKDREEAIIRESGVDWLIVRPAGLTNGKCTGDYRVLNDLHGITSKRISRSDVADFIVKQLREPTEFGNTPLLTY